LPSAYPLARPNATLRRRDDCMTWSDTFLGVFKDNDVKLVSYVPDNVLTPLL